MLKLFLFATFLVTFVIAKETHAQSTATKDIPSAIIAMEKSALDRANKGDADVFPDLSDAEVTYFDPFLDRPIHGQDALREYYHKMSMTEENSGEMTNAEVQVFGDVAVLTFNYASKRLKSGRIVHWNGTEVYRRTAAGWRILHTHWSYLKPQLADIKEEQH